MQMGLGRRGRDISGAGTFLGQEHFWGKDISGARTFLGRGHSWGRDISGNLNPGWGQRAPALPCCPCCASLCLAGLFLLLCPGPAASSNDKLMAGMNKQTKQCLESPCGQQGSAWQSCLHTQVSLMQPDRLRSALVQVLAPAPWKAFRNFCPVLEGGRVCLVLGFLS